jgi:hypothetical protein
VKFFWLEKLREGRKKRQPLDARPLAGEHQWAHGRRARKPHPHSETMKLGNFVLRLQPRQRNLLLLLLWALAPLFLLEVELGLDLSVLKISSKLRNPTPFAMHVFMIEFETSSSTCPSIHSRNDKLESTSSLPTTFAWF